MFHTAKGRGNDKKGRDGKSRPVKDLMAEPTRLELATSGVTGQPKGTNGGLYRVVTTPNNAVRLRLGGQGADLCVEARSRYPLAPNFTT